MEEAIQLIESLIESYELEYKRQKKLVSYYGMQFYTKKIDTLNTAISVLKAGNNSKA